MLKENNSLITSVFFVGAQKCGTSTLYNWLKQDLRLNFPSIKETHYFSFNFDFGIKWYNKQFKINKSNDTLMCEIDPSYIYYPNAINRIYSYNPKSKLIIILRQPLERAYSHYLMSKFRTYESLNFKDALLNESNRLDSDKTNFSYLNFSYLKRSQYSDQIKIINKYFKKENCLFLKFDDLFNVDKQDKILSSIYKIININYNNNIDTNMKSNMAKQFYNNFFQKMLYSDFKLKKIVRKFISRETLFKIKKSFLKINSNNIDINDKENNFNQIVKSLPEHIIVWNNKEVNNLENLLKINLNNWYL